MDISLFYFGIALLYSSLLVTLVKHLQSPAIRSFFIFLIGVFFWVTTLYIYLFIDTGTWLTFWGRFNYAVTILISAGLLSFFYTFPQKTIIFSQKIEKGIFFYSLLLFCLTIFTPYIDKQEIIIAKAPHVIFGEWYFLFALTVIVYFFLTIFIGIKKILSLKGLHRIRFLYPFWTAIISCAIGYALNTVLLFFGIDTFLKYTFLIPLPMVIVSFYAIQKYRFFHLSFVLLNILRTSFLFIFSILAFFIIWYLGRVFMGTSYHESLHLFFSASIAILLFQWLEKKFPIFLPNEFREFRNTLTITSSSLDQCPNLYDLQERLDQTFVLRCNISQVKYFLIAEKKQPKSSFFLTKKETPEILFSYRDGVVTAELQAQRKDHDLLHFLQHIGAEVCFPLFSESHCIGVWFVGKKSDQSLYSHEEIDELNSFSRRLEVVCMNLMITSHLTKENSVMKKIIREKTEQLKKQNAKIKIFSQQQADFIAITAHEFRTPLTVALFQTEILLDEKKIPKHSQEELSIVNNSLQSLKELTEQLFEMQQYDLQKISLEYSPVDFHLFLQKIYVNFSHLMKEKLISFQLENTVPKNTTLSIDQTRMHQVFSNLLSNAIKFTPEKGRITLSAEKKENHIHLVVANTSEKLSPQIKKRMFDKFFTNQGMGLGLGLYIVKNIIDLHHGTISLSEKRGEIRFQITLPV